MTTYCATGNSHDQYFFRRSEQMVAGAVAPPRLDLANEDLVRAHVHAIWLAETGLKLGRAIPRSIDMPGTEPEGRRRPDPRLPLHDGVARDAASPDAARRAIARASAVLRELEDDLATGPRGGILAGSSMLYAPPRRRFDDAFDRWRDLFRAALIDQWEQNRRRLDHSRRRRDRDAAARRRREAETQLTLLLNEDKRLRSLTSDFYPYRYLASEGFLPGYSFPRLPMAAYISVRGRYGADGDYRAAAQVPGHPRVRAACPHLSRGSAVRGQPDPASGRLRRGGRHRPGPPLRKLRPPPRRRSRDRPVRNVRRACSARQPCGLLHLHTVFTRRLERISSDEEERRRAGFRIVTSYSFQRHGDRPGRLDAIVQDAADELVAA